jgi:hypothetical protein
MSEPIRLSAQERETLEGRVRSRKVRAEEARIARVLLLLDEGASYREIQERVCCSAPFISKWKQRFAGERLAGLYSRHRGRKAEVLTTTMETTSLAAGAHRRGAADP